LTHWSNTHRHKDRRLIVQTRTIDCTNTHTHTHTRRYTHMHSHYVELIHMNPHILVNLYNQDWRTEANNHTQYMHTHTHAHTHTHTHTHPHMQTHTCKLMMFNLYTWTRTQIVRIVSSPTQTRTDTHTATHARTHTHTHTHTQTHSPTHPHVYTWYLRCIYKNAWKYVFTQTRTHTHTHTHTHTPTHTDWSIRIITSTLSRQGWLRWKILRSASNLSALLWLVIWCIRVYYMIVEIDSNCTIIRLGILRFASNASVLP